jgi:hypothetical protein
VIAAIAASLSGWGLIVQTRSTELQTKATMDQLRVNEELRTEKKAEYANRVSWWYPESSVLQGLSIQNRSPVPITNVVLRYKARFESDPVQGGPRTDLSNTPVYDGFPVITLGDIPPCMIENINIQAVESMVIGAPGTGVQDGNIRDVAWDHIQFSDVHGSWSVGLGDQPQMLDPQDIRTAGEGDFFLGEDLVTAQPATDCGSG